MKTGVVGTLKHSVIAALAGVALLVWAPAARAATRTWTGAGGDNNWTTAANWGGTAPVASDDLVFPGGAARLANNNDFVAGTSFNTISFTGASGGYTLGGNAIQLMGGVSVANTAGAQTITLAITLGASQTFTCPIDRLFIGDVNLGSFTLTLNVPNFAAVIQQVGTTSGTGGLTTAGSGFVYLGNPCTYSGPTVVNHTGFFTPAALNTASVVSVNSGLLQLVNGGSVGPVTVANGASVYCGGGGISQIGNVTNLVMQSGSQISMDMNSIGGYGQLNASGSVALTGTVILNLNWFFTSATGNAFTILNKTSAGAITGTFVGLPEGATFTGNGRNYQITYVGGDGNDVVVTDIGAAPAPTPTPGPNAIPTTSSGGLAVFAFVLAALGVLLLMRRHAG